MSAQAQASATEESQALAKPPKDPEITYMVAGQEVKLSYTIIRNFLTKGEGKVSDQDLVQFMQICKYNQLNPFLNEAYLVKFGSSPAQMIVSKEAFMKRAEESDNYEGHQAGVIVMRGNDTVELEGCFYLPTDKLVGGWATVYRTDRKFPIVSKVTLEEYDKKQSLWKDKPSTMIRKVAQVQALREAFPTQLGAMYTAEESGVVEGTYEDVSDKIGRDIKANGNKTVISFDGDGVVQPESTTKTTLDSGGNIVNNAKSAQPVQATIGGPGF